MCGCALALVQLLDVTDSVLLLARLVKHSNNIFNFLHAHALGPLQHSSNSLGSRESLV